MLAKITGIRDPERRAASSTRAIESGGNRLGVPPPKKMLTIGLPLTSGAWASMSRSSADTYCASGSVSRSAYELKSQYGHLRTHQGMCT